MDACPVFSLRYDRPTEALVQYWIAVKRKGKIYWIDDCVDAF
jgi:hypothetical protein